MDKMYYYEVSASHLATQALFVMEFSPHNKGNTDKDHFELFSNLIQIWTNLPPNLSKGFIEPHCSFNNIFQMENFSAVKFNMGYEKNMSFLVIPKSQEVWKKKLKNQTWLL